MKRREDSYTERIGGNLKKRSGKSEKKRVTLYQENVG